jgi:hypothetical protein
MLPPSSTLMMEEARSSKTSFNHQTRRKQLFLFKQCEVLTTAVTHLKSGVAVEKSRVEPSTSLLK